MAVSAHKKPHQTAKNQQVIMTPAMQKAFVALVVFSWVGAFVVPLLYMLSAEVAVNEGMYAYIGLQTMAPVIFLLVTMPFAWRRYRGGLKRWFMAFFITLVGVVSYNAVVQVESAFRYKWLLPSQGAGSPGVWQNYSHDITLLSFSLAVYVAFLANWDRRLGRKK